MLFALLIAAGCSKDEDLERLQNLESSPNQLIDRYAGGSQISNPYTVENMQRAMDTIRAKVARGVYTVRPAQGQRSNTDLLDGATIETSHLYVKFTPQSEEEASLLKQDSTIFYADYPLDVEFPESWYTNRPELPEGTLPEYFSSIPVSKSIPSVSSQTLGELYIPEEDAYFNPEEEQPLTRETKINTEEDLLHHLLYEAYVNVGREQELLEDNGSFDGQDGQNRIWIFGRKWYPSGQLQVWDGVVGQTPGGEVCTEQTVPDYSGCYDDDGTFLDCPEYVTTIVCEPGNPTMGSFVPLEGAQVLMRQLFTVRQAITRSDGTFSTGSVRGKARYIVQWERYQYSIRRGELFQAEMRGPKVKDTPWNKNISGPGGRDHYHAHIHHAALNYYYGDRLGTHTPPINEIDGQMKIAAKPLTEGQSSHVPFWAAPTANLVSTIRIIEYDQPAFRIFGTTTHELAHAAHRNLDLDSYSNVVWDAYTNVCFSDPIFDCQDETLGPTANNNRRLMETWATTLETLITLRRYRLRYGENNFNYRLNNFQDRAINDNIHYTAAGIDMVEGNYGLPQINQNNFNANRPIDRVNNFTINQLEDALIDSSSWWEWRDRIFSQNPGNGSRIFLDELFDNW